MKFAYRVVALFSLTVPTLGVAQQVLPALVAPGATAAQVSFEEGQTEFAAGQAVIIAEISNSLRQIPGSAVVLCYGFGADRARDYGLAEARLSSVASALKEREVTMVYKGNHPLCQNPWTRPPTSKAAVQIHRVLPIQ
jgi:hypothetical protein